MDDLYAQNINKDESLRHNAKLLTTLLDVSNIVSSAMEIKPLLEAILDKLRDILEYDNAKIFTFDGNHARIVAHRSLLSHEQEEKFPLALGRRMLTERKPLVIDDIYSDDELAVVFRKNMSSYLDTVFRNAHCWMYLPMIAKNKVIGALTLDHSKPGFYRQRHIDMGLAFASQAAIEFENAKLYNETVKRADEIKTMFNIQQAITSRLELDAVLKLIADEAWRLTHSDSIAVFLVDGEELVLSVISGVSEKGLVGSRLPLKDTAIGECLSKGEIMILDREQIEGRRDSKLVKITKMRTCLCVPLLADKKPVGAIVDFSSLVGEFDSEDERIFNMFAPIAVIGIENARLYQEEKQRHLEDQQRRHVAEGLRDILAMLNSNSSLEEALNFIVSEAARLLNMDCAALYRLNSEKNALVLEAACGMPHLTPGVTSAELGTGVLGKAFMSRKPVVLSDMSVIDYDIGDVPELEDYAEWLENNCAAIIAVPLICKDEVYGGIVLYVKKRNKGNTYEITKEKVDLAMTFADQAALAIDNTRLRKHAEDMAVIAERSRIARDLHDAVTQTLFSASLIADVLPRIWQKNKDDGMKRLEELKQLTRGALAEMRTLLFELRPATLTEAPLEELLRQLSQAMMGRMRIPVALNTDVSDKMPPEVKIAFYRIAQEALNNIAKHACAKKASIDLIIKKDEKDGKVHAELTIADDGCGFDPSKVTAEHFGLGIMRERAGAVGAKVSVQSCEDAGTSIRLEWIG
jgi:signal transduction histidine kinase